MDRTSISDLIIAADVLSQTGRVESATDILRTMAGKVADEQVLRELLKHGRRSHDTESIALAISGLTDIYRAARNPEALANLPKLSGLQEDVSILPRIAGIMDEFTSAGYAPECVYLPLAPDIACRQIDNFQPDIVFVESAWHGNDGLWTRMVNPVSDSLREMIAHCRRRNISTIFWSKEDPVHFVSFFEAASLCDVVFTTDMDCVPAYKQALGHDRVYLLPFAAQPRVHNPIATIPRKDMFNFAGSYYLRYPQRQRDFAAIVNAVSGLRPVEIYDRNHNKDHPYYRFPQRYASMILGSLPFSEIDKAYKGYRYGINMNTIKQSQTMFARRVFELMASNTVVVSNFSRGVRTFFGDLVLCSDNSDQLIARLKALTDEDTHYRKFRLMGLRKVMREHSYAERLTYILSKVLGTTPKARESRVALFAVARDEAAAARLLQAFRAQHYSERRFFLLAPDVKHQANDPQVSWYSDAQKLMADALRDKADFEFFGLLHADDHYGANYITDLALSRRYSDVDGVGKGCRFELQDHTPILRDHDQRYSHVDAMPLRAALVRSFHMTPDLLSVMLREPDTAAITADMGRHLLALDEFNYCLHGAGRAAVARIVDDLDVPFKGVDLAQLYQTAESLPPAPRRLRESHDSSVAVNELAAEFSGSDRLRVSIVDGRLQLVSTLSNDKHAYLWMATKRSRESLNLIEQSTLHFGMDYSTQAADLVLEFYDAEHRKLSHVTLKSGGSHSLDMPEECSQIRIGLRVAGAGTVQIDDIICGTDLTLPPIVTGPSDTLVLAKQYPSYDDLYRYGFLHSRVRAYRRQGVGVDVFRLNPDITKTYEEFENIDVASGDTELLDVTLSSGRYRQVLVHMLDRDMWDVLKRHLDRVRVTIWLHGAEVQSWKRRSYEFASMLPDAIERQKKLSAERMNLWQEVFSNNTGNLSYVAVSSDFYHGVVEDVGMAPSAKQSVEIIHNFIDPGIFRFSKKSEEHRRKILSIRSFDSMTYANDLSARAIMALSDKPFFKELDFLLVGDGVLHEEITGPLRQYTNVKIRKTLITHAEVAQLHKDFGIFLIPTRMDSQGVSRDEAMASGLVPITSDVASVSEFVDESCGFLAPAEDHLGLAQAIEQLYHDPGLFLRMSRAASERVHKQSGFDQTIGKELRLIGRASVN